MIKFAVVTSKEEIRAFVRRVRANCDGCDGETIRVALVPTMGSLHDGHLALIRKAKSVAECVICSIYVNQTQFGPSEDFASYPRDLQGDIAKLRENGCCCVFAPTDMYDGNTGVGGGYGEGNQTWVTVERLQTSLCGKSRPIFFRGVATVVAKLFNIVQPDIAVSVYNSKSVK